jgi:predicted kinase
MEFSGESHPSSLAHHYVAYRAHVRAKIEVIRHHQGVAGAASMARGYHSLTLHHLERAKLRMVLIGGGPGTGKTTLAHSVAQRTGWAVLESDEIRKDLTPLDHVDHSHDAPGEGLYTEAHKAETYDALISRAGSLLDAGESVILDASWTDDRHREAARMEAIRRGAEVVELECVLDADLARHRIAERRAHGDSASEARPEIVDHLAARHDPWPTAARIDTSRQVGTATNQAVDVALDEHGQGTTFDPAP